MSIADRVSALVPSFPSAPGRAIVHVGEYLAVLGVAADILVGDLIIHPAPSEHGALHRVTKVTKSPSGQVVVDSHNVRTGRPRTHRMASDHVVHRVLAGALSLLATVGVFAAGARIPLSTSPETVAPAPPATVTQVAPAPQALAPAPSTPAGYQALFASLDPRQWGAADGAISVALADGRTVWLFGDTMSAREDGFVHSTAIVQTGGVLHVSHRGAQLLPDDDPTNVYWISSASAVDSGHLRVTARTIVLTGSGLWNFADGGCNRTAECTVSPSGDVTFTRWVTGAVRCPPDDPGPMYNFGDGNANHFGYLRFVHRQLVLGSGNVLVTTSQNWSDSWSEHRNSDGSFRWTDYQPVFTEAPADTSFAR